MPLPFCVGMFYGVPSVGRAYSRAPPKYGADRRVAGVGASSETPEFAQAAVQPCR